MIKCPNCGGEMEFRPGEDQVVCKYCASKFNPKELNLEVKMSKENEALKTFEGKSYSCSQCGAQLMTFDETAVTFCSYCGSQAMIESKMLKQNSPDFIIPFSVTREDCIKAYKRKLSNALFVPNYMKSDLVVEKFRGIYLPYCIYKLERHGNCFNKGSKYSHRSGDYVYYDDYKISSDIDASYDGISYDLISKYYDKYSVAIPFNYKKKEVFNPNYLVGFYADTKDVDSSIYECDAQMIAEADLAKRMKSYSEFRKYGCSSPKANINVSDKKIGMFPVYFLAIRNKDNKTINYAVVNGQTGKVAADLPISFTKYIIGSLILAFILFLIIDNLFVFTPKTIAVISIISSVVSLIISFVQGSLIHTREFHTDDLGYMSIEKNKKASKKKKGIFKYLYKEIIGIVIPIAVLLLNPVNDGYYYIASIISLIFVILSFKDLVKEHNIIVSNKLPQLDKRGGDLS